LNQVVIEESDESSSKKNVSSNETAKKESDGSDDKSLQNNTDKGVHHLMVPFGHSIKGVKDGPLF
jgi:hypothetical protein